MRATAKVRVWHPEQHCGQQQRHRSGHDERGHDAQQCNRGEQDWRERESEQRVAGLARGQRRRGLAEQGEVAGVAVQAQAGREVGEDAVAGALPPRRPDDGDGFGVRGVQAGLGEVISYRHAVHAMRDGMIEHAEPGWNGSLNPNAGYAHAYAAMAPGMYRRIREIIETVVASGLIYLNSNAVDFDTPEIRPYLDRYLRGTGGRTAIDRSKTMKLLWDAVGSEFGARHELYELNYFGQPEINHLTLAELSKVDGTFDHARHLVETCMNQYDLSGWTDPRFINSDDVNFIALRKK